MQPHPDGPPRDEGGGTIHTLHVDDEPGFAEMTAEFLEREEGRLVVETATSAEEGLERLAEGDFDCVVSDYDMPGRNGIEFLGTVREEHPGLPFVLFTGKGSEEIASEAISAGVTDYLQKEGGIDQYTILANRITNVVDGYRSQRGLSERNRRLETLISNLPGFVYRCRNEPGWPMEFVEGECEQLTGYTAGALESGEVVWGEDVIHPDDREEMWDAVQEAMAAGDSFEVTYRIVTDEGTTRWMWERGRAVGSADGEREILEGFVTDITARKNDEAERERTNAVLSTLFDALPVGVLAEDASREIMTANERTMELLDLDGTAESVTGADCAELAADVKGRFADPEAFVETIEGLIDERTPSETELPLADGRTLEQDHRPIELPDGRGHLWVYRDVTDRIEREHELERYETLVETVARGVFAQDSDGRYSFVNSHIEEQTGYDRAELVGEYPSKFLPEEDVERINDGVREMLFGDRETVAFESEITTASGEKVPIEGQLALLPSEGEFNGTVGVVRDISERTERERKLERLRERSQALSYTETKTETAEVAAEAANEIIGAPLSGVHLLNDDEDALEPVAVVEAVDDAFDEVPRYPRDADPESRAALVWDAFENGEPLHISDTDDFDRLSESTPARSVVVHPVGRYGVFVVSAEEADAFDDSDETLVELLATSLRTGLDRVEREAELRHQRDELRRRNERLDQFTSVVSHDLRNPLDVAQGRLTLARREDDGEHLGEIADAHDRMEALIDDLLTLAREGQTATTPEPVNLAELVEGCWRTVETDSAKLVVDTDRVVTADRSQLQRLLENLFRNAVEHGSTGSQGPPDPDDPAEHGGENVVVTVDDLADGFYVADDGPGIPPDERGSVFETGYSTTPHGTGFGLSIVEEIATAHGWTVTATESEDGGARFEVRGLGEE